MIHARATHSEKVGAVVELLEGPNDVVILKAYVSPDGKKVRIVLPEFGESAQVSGNLERHFLEFKRRLV